VRFLWWGQPLTAVTAKLGAPTEERATADTAAYIWSSGADADVSQRARSWGGTSMPSALADDLLQGVNALSLPDRGPQPFGGRRHVDMADAVRPLQGIDDRVHHRRRRADGAGLAGALEVRAMVRV